MGGRPQDDLVLLRGGVDGWARGVNRGPSCNALGAGAVMIVPLEKGEEAVVRVGRSPVLCN